MCPEQRVTIGNTIYRFVWMGFDGWVPINRNNSRRLSAVPIAAWKKLADVRGRRAEQQPKPKEDE